MKIVKLHDPNNSGNYIQFLFEKSIEQSKCSVTLSLQNENQNYTSEKYLTSFEEIKKISDWYLNMNNFSGEYPDLILKDLPLSFYNFFFEKGEGVYYLKFTSVTGKIFQFHFWEQLGNSNTFIADEFQQSIEKCK